ncbi:zinc ribbon domain-containing protein [Anaerotardibacter muris]|uniref:zinc ribbon domain-containing protein n=1 Tax=Anaerotardibacter muris TaxID=2941505 RepID=UPI00203BC2B0|nr:hypothetical protein [Anaerotardibacter muris]
MLATPAEVDALEQLQSIDIENIHTSKKLEELPQRQALLEVRQKLAAIVKKKTQVQDMLDTAEDELHGLMAEDERLAAKQQETQEALERVQGDYRSVESYTKDLHGVAKRREKLAEDMERVDQQIERVKPLMDQIMDGCANLEAREKDLIASFQQEGGALQRTIAENNARHQALQDKVNPELYRAYQRACKECGGIGVAQMVDGACSACRSVFDASKIARIKQDAPVSKCPSCRRLLIVSDQAKES